jgi:RNA polymerase sigma-70 factor (ECF subfamily)
MAELRSSNTEVTVAKGACFPATRWSLIAGAQDHASDVVRSAMAQLCDHYWRPIYAFLRRTGHPHADAEDLTQSFFLSLLDRDVFARINPDGGKLRTYLLASLKNHLANERRAAGRQKRGGQAVIISINAEEFEGIESEMLDEVTPERAFDREWVLALLHKVLTELEQEYLLTGKGPIFRALRSQLVDHGESASYAEIGSELGVSEGTVRVAAHRLRGRYREMLIAEVAETVEGPAAVGGELDFLLQTLG